MERTACRLSFARPEFPLRPLSFYFFRHFISLTIPPGIKNVSSALLVQPPSIYLLRTEEIEQLQFRLAIKPYKNMYTCTVFYTVGKSSAGNFECDR